MMWGKQSCVKKKKKNRELRFNFKGEPGNLPTKLIAKAVHNLCCSKFNYNTRKRQEIEEEKGEIVMSFH